MTVLVYLLCRRLGSIFHPSIHSTQNVGENVCGVDEGMMCALRHCVCWQSSKMNSLVINSCGPQLDLGCGSLAKPVVVMVMVLMVEDPVEAGLGVRQFGQSECWLQG